MKLSVLRFIEDTLASTAYNWSRIRTKKSNLFLTQAYLKQNHNCSNCFGRNPRNTSEETTQAAEINEVEPILE
jgi:hypothetical protein